MNERFNYYYAAREEAKIAEIIRVIPHAMILGGVHAAGSENFLNPPYVHHEEELNVSPEPSTIMTIRRHSFAQPAQYSIALLLALNQM